VIARDDADLKGHHDAPFAVVCTSVGCSKGITDPSELKQKLRPVVASQI
jgi:hypothetical protein